MQSQIGTVCVPVLLSCVIAACDPRESVSPRETPSLPEAAFRVVDEVTLDESPDVINVTPDITVEEDGSFLIADGREARIRKYGPSGELIYQIGRRGDGPGEFGMPLEVERRSDNDNLQVLDISKGLIEFDPTGERHIVTTRLTIRPAYTAEALGEHRTLLAGLLMDTEDPRPLLHIWDGTSQTPSHSFFPTPGDSLTRLAARNFGWADFARKGDSIVAIAAFTDTLFVFGLEGQALGRVPLPIQGFPHIDSYEPQASPPELQRWLDDLLLLVDVYWLDDGSFLVQYQRPRGADNEWNLVRTNMRGHLLLDVRNTPQLLAVADGRLYFIDPRSLTPNRWVIAEFQR